MFHALLFSPANLYRKMSDSQSGGFKNILNAFQSGVDKVQVSTPTKITWSIIMNVTESL